MTDEVNGRIAAFLDHFNQLAGHRQDLMEDLIDLLLLSVRPDRSPTQRSTPGSRRRGRVG